MAKHNNNRGNKSQFTNKSKGKKNSKPRGVKAQDKVYPESTFDTDYGTNKPGRNDLPKMDESILKALGSPSFANPIGRPLYNGINLPDDVTIHSTQNVNASSIPGIMTFNMYYGPGYSVYKTDPLNMVAQKLWNELRKGITGSTRKYGTADLTMAILAIDSLYVMYNYIKRFFGIYRKWTNRNAYTPRYFFSAANVDYDSFVANLPGLNAELNLLAKRISIFKVPAGLELLMRHSKMVSSIYADGEKDRCQYYWAIPAGYYTWEDQLDPNGSRLKWHWLPNHSLSGYSNPTLSIPFLMGVLKNMVDKMYYSTALLDMAGDIEKAFGGADSYLSLFNLDYEVEYEFRDSWLFEFQNATSLLPVETPDADDDDFFDVYQDADEGLLHCTPRFKVACAEGSGVGTNIPIGVFEMPTILNIGNYSPTPEIVVENCQLKPLVKSYDEENRMFTVSYQSEILCGFWMTHLAYSDATSLPFNSMKISSYFDLADIGPTTSLNLSLMLSEFSYHPHVYVSNTVDGVAKIVSRLADTRNYTIVSNDTIAKQHEAMLYALYGI